MRQQSDPQKLKKSFQMNSDGEEDQSWDENESGSESENKTSENEGKTTETDFQKRDN